jgi:hypothetical protein
LSAGLFPIRFVHTLKVPNGVVIGIILTPPEKASGRFVRS